MIIKILDKYLLTQFIKALIGSMIFMVGLYMITLYLDNLKYFTHQKVPAEMVLSYLLNSIPEIIIYVLPVAALFSTSYIFGHMNSTNEIIALYNGRIGFARLISPLLAIGIIISIMSFLFFEFVAAESSHEAFNIRNKIKKLTGKSLSYMYSNSKTFIKGNNNTIYYVDFFNADNGTMQGPAIFQFDTNGDMVFQLNAISGIYNKKEQIWIFSNVHIIHYSGKGKYSEERKPEYSMKIIESPDDFTKTPVTLMQMRMNDALNFIEAKRRSGGDYKKYLVEFHWRFAFPFAIFIMILIGSVAGIYFRKAVLVLALFLALLISFGYYGIIALGLAFGKSGKIDPIAAAWIGNIIFLAGGILALRLKK